MNTDFINVTTENIYKEHLSCIIRSKKPHPGIDAKRKWLYERLQEGHVFRKLNEFAERRLFKENTQKRLTASLIKTEYYLYSRN